MSTKMSKLRFTDVPLVFEFLAKKKKKTKKMRIHSRIIYSFLTRECVPMCQCANAPLDLYSYISILVYCSGPNVKCQM